MQVLESPVRPAVSLDEARRHCRDLTWRSAKNFFYAFLFLSTEQREAAFAIYAFCRVADDLADDESRPPTERLEALARYETDLDACLAGRPVADPVFVALRAVLDRVAVPERGFRLMLEGVRQDLVVDRYRTFDELADYCFKVASTVALLLMPVFDPQRPGDYEPYVRAGGVAVQLTNILRDIKEDAARGRIYLPADDMAQFGVDDAMVLSGEPTEPLRLLIAFEVERAERLYDEAERLVTPRDRQNQIVLETSRTLYRRLLSRIRDRRYDVFSCRVALSPLRKLQISLGVRIRGWIGR